MRVALGQLDMVWEDKEASLKKAERMIQEAAKACCDLIVFPEMSFTGYSMNVEKIGEAPQDSYTKDCIRTFARKYERAIGFGYAIACEEGESRGKNGFAIIDKEGMQIAEYAKLHPFTYGGEANAYRPGDEIVTVPFMGRRLGLFICYDLRFPEIFNIAAREADILICIANWPAIRSVHWTTLLRARAIETQSYVIGVNCVGERDNTCYSGDSMAVDSIGNILGEISNREGILVCDLDDRAWNLRKKFATAADRREVFYSSYFAGKREISSAGNSIDKDGKVGYKQR